MPSVILEPHPLTNDMAILPPFNIHGYNRGINTETFGNSDMIMVCAE